MTEMMIHFPWLHPRLSPGHLPERVVFLDPGMALASDLPRWSPPGLPLSETEVRQHLRGYLEFAKRFPKTSDMQAYQAAGLENFYTDTTMDIRSRLTDQEPAAKSTDLDRRRQAQLFLALALYREEQFVALGEQEERFEHARESFAQVLGLDDDESFAEFGVSDEALFPRAAVELPWKTLLPPMLLFLPSGAGFFVSDADVARELAALDLEWTSGEPGSGLVRCRVDADAVWRISGVAVDLPEPVTMVTLSSNL
jgi:hypothetical protein